MKTSNPIRVLIVDDSLLVRRILTAILDTAAGIEVVGTAQDPYEAREKIKALNPDVLTLDVEMPRMDGLTFLRNLMRLRPMPVVMVSTLTAHGAKVSMDALEIGAVDVVRKPDQGLVEGLRSYEEELIEKIRVAAKVRVRATPSKRSSASIAGAPAATRIAPPRISQLQAKKRVILIGASTGGTEAIKDVLLRLPADVPGILIAQHIPPGFSAAFAERMNRQTGLVVKEAVDGDAVLPGHAYVAPGDWHLLLASAGAGYACRLTQGELVNRHRPSVDVLFRSAATAAGSNACAVLLTGMGADGAQGLKELRDLGVHTIAQDEATSVVWGMPGEAVKRDAAVRILPLHQISGAIYNAVAS